MNTAIIKLGTTALSWIKNHYRTLIDAILGVLAALFLTYGVVTHKNNLKLTESLNKAENNIEAYLGLLSSPLLAFNVLLLQPKDLENSLDPVINKLTNTAKENNIKTKDITSAATQTQTLVVNSKEPIRIYIDTLYLDSIVYNKYTKLYYTLNKDTLSTILDIKNTLDLIIHNKRVYKNKKSFIKRLLTLDFKKINKLTYDIINSNDLIKTDSVRVIQID